MSFRGEKFVFASPAEAVAGMIDRLGSSTQTRREEFGELRGGSLLGRVLAEPVHADRDSPAFDYSSMDGYAARVADLCQGVARDSRSQVEVSERLPGDAGEGTMWPVLGEATIGVAPPALPEVSGVIRMVTGAGLPDGADVVIKREDVVEHPAGGSGGVVSIGLRSGAAERLRPGDNIRRRGENAKAGAALLHAGVVLSAAAHGTLAAVGCVRPRLFAKVRVAILTTGDEVVAPDAVPEPFQLRNSNGPAVAAMLGACPWIQVVSVHHVLDDGEQLRELLDQAVECADAVVLTGGVSMGHRDPVRAAVESCGARVVFHGVPQRPGKPMLGAIMKRLSGGSGECVPVFGLPGNPVSALVTCRRIVVPVLSFVGGISGCTTAPELPAGNLQSPISMSPERKGAGSLPGVQGPLAYARRSLVANPDGKAIDLWWHRLVRMNQYGEAVLMDGKSSGDIVAAGQSDGFIEVPPLGWADAAGSAGGCAYYAWNS